jgi:predicted dehydrogenase
MMHASGATGLLAHLEGAMKVGLLGTGFGIAHARIYHTHPQVSEVVVFGRTPAKLQAFAEEFGYATTTDPTSIYNDPTVDLVDVCLPTPLHAEHVTRALHAGKHVLCELPLATTMDDARRIVDAQAASDRQVFVDMFGRFDPATEVLHTAIAQRSYGTLQTLTMELRTALLWEGYQIGLDSIAMDVLHSGLDAIVTALGRPESLTAMGVARRPPGRPPRCCSATRPPSCGAAPPPCCPSRMACVAATGPYSPAPPSRAVGPPATTAAPPPR